MGTGGAGGGSATGRHHRKRPSIPRERPPIPRDRRARSGRGMFADSTAPGADVQSLWRSARSARCEAVRHPWGGPAPRPGTAGQGAAGGAAPSPNLLGSCPDLPPPCWSVTSPQVPRLQRGPGQKPPAQVFVGAARGRRQRGLCLPASSVPLADLAPVCELPKNPPSGCRPAV